MCPSANPSLSRWSSALRELRRDGGRKAREAWEALRGHVRGAVRIGMRRLVVAHSDEQGSAGSEESVVWVHAVDGRRVLLAAGAPVRLPRMRPYVIYSGVDS